VPWSEDSTYLSPGGSVAGISAFAAAATSPGRSKGFRIFVRIVVVIVLISLFGASVWRMGGGF
jgi:cobalamin biosynthesis Mg chelatase CobN